MKLARKHIFVLRKLAQHSGYIHAANLPSGNGLRGGVMSTTLKALKDVGLIEYGKEPLHSLYGYRITDAGRRALQQEDGNGE